MSYLVTTCTCKKLHVYLRVLRMMNLTCEMFWNLIMLVHVLRKF